MTPSGWGWGGGEFYDTLTAAPNAQIGAPKSRGGLRGPHNVNNMGPHGPLSNGGPEILYMTREIAVEPLECSLTIRITC